MSKPGWLRCKLHRGMFSDEYAVIVERSDGKLLTFFAPEDFVDAQRKPKGSEEIDGKIRVQIVDEKTVAVILPREPFEDSRFIQVSISGLAPA